MEESLPSLERAKEFIDTGNIDYLISPLYFQVDVLFLQILTVGLLSFIAYKVSKFK